MKKVITHRLDIWKEEPAYWNHVAGIDSKLYASSLPHSLIEIIKIRVSQINKCAFCIDYHSEEAIKHGELPRRIFALSAWKESPLFEDSEKSALQMAEEITHISVNGVADQTYENAKVHFNTREIADIITCTCLINFLNRVGITTQTVAV